jgi:16S rRNA (guanine966-N2)-methyltransferase
LARLTLVTRIISGAAGSLRLKGPAKATRPTSDRVKESVFAKLESMGAIADARVLDLYAGTGALGLEAASRGAASVMLVEKDPAAAAVCAENLKAIQASFQKQGLVCELKMEKLDASKFAVKSLSGFDLVFIDPPYELPNQAVEFILGSIVSSLNTDSVVVVERGSRSEELKLPEGLNLESLKNYGDTSVFFLTN